MDISKELEKRVGEAMDMVPDMVAERATEYFKERFKEKEFDGTPWPGPGPNYKRTNGSLLVDTSALMNSIRPCLISAEKTVISAGNSKVGYAKAHNEGFIGSVVVKEHKRTSKKGKKYTVKQHTQNRKIPQRQFVGESRALYQILKTDIP